MTRSLPLLLLALFVTTARAQQYFDFIQDGTGDTLATLEVLSLPADELADFGTLTLTTEGSIILGYPVGTYAGAFDSISGPAVNLDGGNLVVESPGLLQLDDSDPPASSVLDSQGEGPVGFFIGFNALGGAALTNLYSGPVPSLSGGRILSVEGVFTRAIPEPSSAMLVVAIVVCCVRSRQRA